MLKINPLDAHDRLKEFKKTDHSIGECCQNLIDQAPFGNRPFYIFAHARTDDDGIKTRMIWQPRLTKPKAQTNSMLFKGYPGSDRVDIIWMIPKRELWPNFHKDKMTADPIIYQSTYDFQFNRKKLEVSDPDDPTDQEIDAIYRSLAIEGKRKKIMDKLYLC